MAIQQHLLDLGDLINFSLPADVYSAKYVANLYQERWETELQGHQEFHAAARGDPEDQKIRPDLPRGMGLLLAYNVIHREASQAAVAFSRSPSEMRFKPVCQYIAVQLIVMAAANRYLLREDVCQSCGQGSVGCFWITVQAPQGKDGEDFKIRYLNLRPLR